MKKSIIAILLTAAVLLSSFAFVSCGKKDDAEPALMTVDINPSVEFVLDGDNKVVSVTALNDDGAVILSGEVFVGLTAEEAAQKVVSISIETGFISEEDAKKITLTISGADAEKLFETVSERVAGFVKEQGIDSAVERGQALAEEQLKALLLAADPTLTQEEVDAFTAKQTLEKLGEVRKEYAAMVTEQMRDAYLKFKESKISFAEGEKTAAIIEGLGSAYESVLDNYNTAMAQIDVAADNLNKLYYEWFLDENSAYQIAAARLKTARIQLGAVKKATTAEELLSVLSGEDFQTIPGIDGIRYALNSALVISSVSPSTLQAAFDTAMAAIIPALESVMDVAEGALALAKQQAESAVKTANDTLAGLKERMVEIRAAFPDEIKTELAAKATEVEKAVNDAKTAALNEFEEEYAEAIERMNARIAAQKAALKNAAQ